MENRIQELRRGRRIRQEDLAEAVGVTRQTIISLENGRYNASLGLVSPDRPIFRTEYRRNFYL